MEKSPHLSELTMVKDRRRIQMNRNASTRWMKSSSPKDPSLDSKDIFRGTVARKRKNRVEKRQMIIEEILETERTYVNALTLLTDTFLDPLETAAEDPETEIIPKSMISSIFSNIRAIQKCNELLLKDLEQRANEWHSSKGIGDVFALFAPYFALYKDYINNHENALQLLKQLLGTFPQTTSLFSNTKRKKVEMSKKFSQFLRERSRSSNVPVQSYLIMPIQRIPRYQLLLDEAKKNTETDHPDYKHVSKALEQVKMVADEINRAIQSSENSDAIIALQKRFTDHIQLMEYNRTLILEGQLRAEISHIPRSKRSKKYYFVLFSDMLLYAVGKKKLELRDITVFDEYCFIVDNPKTRVKVEGANQDDANCFQFVHKDGVIDFFAENEEMKKVWMGQLCEGIADAHQILLFEAAWRDNEDLIQALVMSKADMNVKRDRSGNFPLFFAAFHGNLDAIKALVEIGSCDMNVQNLKGRTALMAAVLNAKEEAAQFLLEKGADCNLVDIGDFNALMYIAANESYRPDEEFEDEFEMLQPSISPVSSAFLQSLIERSNLNRQTSEGFTAFMLACHTGKEEIALMILERGFDLSLIDHRGRSCLFHALHLRNANMIQLLVKAGCSLETVDDEENTLLMISAELGIEELVSYFLEHGLVHSQRNKNGKTAIDLSSTDGVTRMLLKANSFIDPLALIGLSTARISPSKDVASESAKDFVSGSSETEICNTSGSNPKKEGKKEFCLIM